jgi:hypothetical protein
MLRMKCEVSFPRGDSCATECEEVITMQQARLSLLGGQIAKTEQCSFTGWRIIESRLMRVAAEV